MIHALRANSLMKRLNQARNAAYDKCGDLGTTPDETSNRKEVLKCDLICSFTRPFLQKQCGDNPEHPSTRPQFRGCIPPRINSGIYDDYRSYYDRQSERPGLPPLEEGVPSWETFSRLRHGDLTQPDSSQCHWHLTASSAIVESFRLYYRRSKPISIPFDFQSKVEFLLSLIPPVTVIAKLERQLMNQNNERKERTEIECDPHCNEKAARARLAALHGGYRHVIPLRRSFRHLHIDLG